MDGKYDLDVWLIFAQEIWSKGVWVTEEIATVTTRSVLFSFLHFQMFATDEVCSKCIEKDTVLIK